MLFDNINFANGTNLENRMVLVGTSFPDDVEDGSFFLHSDLKKMHVKIQGIWERLAIEQDIFTDVVLSHNDEFEPGEYYQLNYPILHDSELNTDGVFKSISSSPVDSLFAVMVNGEVRGEIMFKANSQSGAFIGAEYISLSRGDVLSIGTPAQDYIHGMVLFGFTAIVR